MKLIFSLMAVAAVTVATAQTVHSVPVAPVSPVKALASIPDTLYVGSAGQFSCPTNQLQYTWTFDDGSAETHAQAASHAFANVGIYSVRLTVTDGSTTDELRKNVLVMPVIRQHAPYQPRTVFTVSPNPATDGHFQLQFGTAADRHITVMNTVGDVLLVRDTDSLQPEFDLSGQSTGIYMVRVEEAGGKTGIKKIVLQ